MKLSLPFKGRAGVGMGSNCLKIYGATELYSSFLMPYFFIFR
jgi:hypothetical protein